MKISGHSVDAGGGISCFYSSPKIENCIITGNTTVLSGAGVSFTGESTPSIINSTITGNTAGQHGGAIYCFDSASQMTVEVINSILWGNSGNPNEVSVNLCHINISYSIINPSYISGTGTWSLNNNINANPSLDANYHLTAGSPCIDSGTNTGAPSNDIDGNGRPYDVTSAPNNPTAFDMGADEFTERIYYSTNGHYYQRFDDTMNWHDAKAHCESVGGYLATITSQGENDFIATNLLPNAPYTAWLGGTDESHEGDWEWITGEPWSYTNWKSGEPNNTLSHEHYLATYLNGQWNDLGSLGYGAVGNDYNISEKTRICEWGDGAASCQIYVPDDYSTIQDAIDNAPDGCEIIVRSNTYNELITFNGSKTITVHSESGASVTTIDGSGLFGSVVRFTGGDSSTIDGFTITGGTGSNNEQGDNVGGGIFCSYSSPIIANCAIEENSVIVDGGAIYFSESVNPIIKNCKMIENTAQDDGGGIACWNSPPSIDHCIIDKNKASNNGGGMHISGPGSSPAITNCLITNNIASNIRGGGIHCWFNATPKITNCTIVGNSSVNGGAIACHNSASPIVVNSIFGGNNAGGNPDEIYLADAGSSINITYSDIEGGWGGAGNINIDPELDVNYYLTAGSPCIDAGTMSGAPEYDIEGDPRLSSVGGDNQPDIGADEYGSSGGQIEKIIDNSEVAVYAIPYPLNDYTQQLQNALTSEAIMQSIGTLFKLVTGVPMGYSPIGWYSFITYGYPLDPSSHKM